MTMRSGTLEGKCSPKDWNQLAHGVAVRDRVPVWRVALTASASTPGSRSRFGEPLPAGLHVKAGKKPSSSHRLGPPRAGLQDDRRPLVGRISLIRVSAHSGRTDLFDSRATRRRTARSQVMAQRDPATSAAPAATSSPRELSGVLTGTPCPEEPPVVRRGPTPQRGLVHRGHPRQGRRRQAHDRDPPPAGGGHCALGPPGRRTHQTVLSGMGHAPADRVREAQPQVRRSGRDRAGPGALPRTITKSAEAEASTRSRPRHGQFGAPTCGSNRSSAARDSPS